MLCHAPLFQYVRYAEHDHSSHKVWRSRTSALRPAQRSCIFCMLCAEFTSRRCLLTSMSTSTSVCEYASSLCHRALVGLGPDPSTQDVAWLQRQARPQSGRAYMVDYVE